MSAFACEYRTVPLTPMLWVKYHATSPLIWKPTYDFFTCSVTARENVAVSNGYCSVNSTSFTKSCCNEMKEGPPPTPTSSVRLMRARQSALTCTVCSWCVSGSEVPVKSRGLLKKNGFGTEPVMFDGSSSLKLVNVTAATRLCHARTPPPTAKVGAFLME